MAESVEKLEDGIVRSAEQVSGQIRAAKEAIASVIFGQDRVIENTLVTILSGGHALEFQVGPVLRGLAAHGPQASRPKQDHDAGGQGRVDDERFGTGASNPGTGESSGQSGKGRQIGRAHV